MGRPTKFTEPVIEKILDSIRLGRTESYSCNRANVSYQRFNAWKNKSPKNAERVNDALEEWVDVHLQNIDRHAKDVWTCSAWRLERRFPERFAKPETQIAIAIQNNGAGRADDPTTTWLDAVASNSAIPALPEDITLELPPPEGMAESEPKHSVDLPTTPIELEQVPADQPEPPEPSWKRQLKDSELTPVERLQRYGSSAPGLPGSPRGLTVAARPTVRDPNYNDDGSLPYL